MTRSVFDLFGIFYCFYVVLNSEPSRDLSLYYYHGTHLIVSNLRCIWTPFQQMLFSVTQICQSSLFT